ncbi:MAG: porin family protein [Bacteroidota bacterium]|nr:porin family protein [Bacteroidota bacterium]
MRKSLAIAMAALLCCTVLFGQDGKNKTAFGFKTGMNFSTFRQVVSYPTYQAKLKLGFVFGGFVDIPVSDRVNLQPEFLYSQMGAKAFDATTFGDVRLRYNYFSVPFLVKYKATKTLKVFIGPEADFLIRARQKDYLDHSTSVTNQIKDFDFAFTVGFEAWATKHIVVGVRYIHGSQDVSTTPSQNTLFNQGIQVTAGYKLFRKAKKAKKEKHK